MKFYIIVGIILIAVAVAAFAYQGINFTTREKIVDLGPLQMTAEKTSTLELSPAIGSFALIGGIALVVVGIVKS